MLPDRIEKKHRVTNKEGMRENNFQTIIIIHFPDLSSLFEDLLVLNLARPSECANDGSSFIDDGQRIQDRLYLL